MKVKKKICKGSGKAKGFESCGELKYRHRYGLCSSCFAKWLYGTPEGLIVLEKAAIKATSDRRGLEQMEAEIKDRQSLSSLILSLITVFHEYIRLRDKYKPCAACGTAWHNGFQASHYYKADTFPSLRFHEFNVHGGCVLCNCRKDGNLSEYAVRLPNIIGQEEFDKLVVMADLEKKTDFKWDREELKRLRIHYRKKLNELKNTNSY